MTKLFISILLLFSASCILGQGIQLSAKEVDSIVSLINTTTQLRNAIVDGIIKPKGKRKPKGGFSDTYLLLPKTNQLVKVEHAQSLFFTDYATYYFFNDSLIFVKTTRYNLSGDFTNKVSSGQYYFVNGILVNKKEDGKSATRPDVFLIHARQYLTDVKSVFSL